MKIYEKEYIYSCLCVHTYVYVQLYVYTQLYICIYIYIYIQLNHFAIYQKLTQYCKPNILQLKKRKEIQRQGKMVNIST